MELEFFKYHGAGNDFIILDNRTNAFPKKNRKEVVSTLCKRHFGIGSDGLILIQEDDDFDFYMEFYNPDGSQSFCGNGSRCAVMFAFHMGMVGKDCTFNSIHGRNTARVVNENAIELSMFDVSNMELTEEYHFIDTGSPHYNLYVENIDNVDLLPLARSIRYNDRFAQVGTNVNIIDVISDADIRVRTYERGVENETLACGTGVTACAISQLLKNKKESGVINVLTKGGNLSVEVGEVKSSQARDIKLTGPAKFVFKGEVNV
ncbi:diaminopimelate epimerase [Parvicella tangerina]|uniref:Diaminopimelate epimerase n=1 Tax=Parvicella tangerina TaxID=2829795 RepID=A0A916JQE4_9FLAO|nr:diaminopimelate epimerase [Parvicella tangerina]CAG5084581.1 Diaminopimelate epimerase [Parvicella tangerina]